MAIETMSPVAVKFLLLAEARSREAWETVHGGETETDDAWDVAYRKAEEEIAAIVERLKGGKKRVRWTGNWAEAARVNELRVRLKIDIWHISSAKPPSERLNAWLSLCHMGPMTAWRIANGRDPHDGKPNADLMRALEGAR